MIHQLMVVLVAAAQIILSIISPHFYYTPQNMLQHTTRKHTAPTLQETI